MYRKRKGFSQEALSEKLNIGPNHLSKIERGVAFVSAELLEHLIHALGVPAPALFASAGETGDDGALVQYGRIVEEELRRTAKTITRRMRRDFT